MPNAAYFELTISGQPERVVPIDELPFLIGRGRENGNHLTLNDAGISRKCIAISAAPSGLQIEDRGQLGGIFVNGRRVTEVQLLHDGDRIRPGAEEAYQLVFRSTDQQTSGKDGSASPESLHNLLDQAAGNSRSKLDRLTLLLEATSLLHAQLPLDSIFATMLDHAISVTNADRGMLLGPDGSGALQVRVARDEKHENLATDAVNPSSTVLQQAIEQQSTVINEDLRLADLNVQTAHSVVVQFLRSAVVIPLYNVLHESDATADIPAPKELLGALYLDSKRTSAFSVLDRKILDALGAQAANILENARLMQRERERQRLEQELNIAHRIQQALLPQGLRDYPHLAVTGIHHPCHEVGGDYFDVFPMADGRIAILVADVSGKGLGAALVTTILQGALSGMPLGVEPVKLIEHLNKFILDRADLGRYLTMFLGLLGPDGILEFVSAGHPSPLVLRYGKVSELYTEGSFPVGLIPEASYTASRVQLEPDDTLLLFTDGVTEAEGKGRSFFETERLMEAFARHSDCSLDRLQSGIFDAVEKFSAGTKQSDDMTLLLVRYRKTGWTAKTGLHI